MTNKFFKILLLTAVMATCFFGFLYFEASGESFLFFKKQPLSREPEVEEQDLLEVSFLDIGQGDATYIRTPEGQDILIDGGPDKNILSQLGRVMPFWDHEIEVMILTHPHADHVTGLVEVLRRYEVKQIYYPGVLHTSSIYQAWLDEIKKQNLSLHIVSQPFDMDLRGGIKLKFLYPDQDFANKKVENLNNTSIVNKLIYQEVSFLLTGDIEKEVEDHLLEKYSGTDILKSNILKLSHHGSSSSNTEEFLQAVDPEVATICVGRDNDFGHPHGRVLHRLRLLDIPFFRLDQDGLVKISTDGQDLIY
ncbi:MAG TPA: MBL fold metallo-hydrolase [Patescibacteria group bacterium]|nr:MBL fold metallo-hydrolase [Patescibacteria group bacterium]